MARGKWLLLSALILFSMIKPVNAQNSKVYLGNWQGMMKTTFQGQNYQSSLSLRFDAGGKATFTMSKVEEGTYEINGDKVSIFIGGNRKEEVRLYNVRLDQASFTADISLPGDPVGVSSTVNLSRVLEIVNRNLGSASGGCRSEERRVG